MANQRSVFISYHNPEQHRVLPFYEALKARGVSVWMDCKELRAGQDWSWHIDRAQEAAAIVVAFISLASLERRGNARRELNRALQKTEQMLADDIYLIPVLLDEGMPVPQSVSRFQCVWGDRQDAIDQVASAIEHQLRRLVPQSLTWQSSWIREKRNAPGAYVVDLECLSFLSGEYPRVGEFGDVLRGDAMRIVLEQRAQSLMNDDEDGSRGGPSYYYSACGEPARVGDMLSVVCSDHWYKAGAAHGNSDFRVYNYAIEEGALVNSLFDVFEYSSDPLRLLQQSIRQTLSAFRYGDSDSFALDVEDIAAGTAQWSQLSTFSFGADGISFLFAPYLLGPYVAGEQIAVVPYEHIKSSLRPEYRKLLGI